MAVIDRNILRLGTCELLYRGDIPPKVAINEAIELGKLYSTAESGTFVNGILDRIKNSVARKVPLAEGTESAGGEAEPEGTEPDETGGAGT
jgi:hypothetical protein